MSSLLRILVIDDEKIIREGCKLALSDLQYYVATVEDGSAALDLLMTESFDIVLLDLMMPGVDGLAVLKWIRQNQPNIQVIIITGFATVQKAVEAMKTGAFDFVGKPFTPDYIRIVVQRASDNLMLRSETEKLRKEKATDLFTITQEQRRLKTVFNCIDGAVIVTNRDGKIVLHNPAAVSVLNLTSESVVGQSVSQVIRYPSAADMIHEVLQDLVAVTREFEPGTVSSLYLRACCAPVNTATGKIFGSVTVFEDITTKKRAEQLKSEFVSMLAHELRAPLAAIEQMIHAIRICPEEDQRNQFMSRIQKRTHSLLQMIESLLNLARLDAGFIALTMEPFQATEIIKEAIDLFHLPAEDKNIQIMYSPPEGEVWINVDRDQIRSVFANLLDNAIKYTPVGKEISVSIVQLGDFAVVEITDTGIGISKDDLPHVFDQFFRVKGSATRGIIGSGLGLPLAKRIVEAHKGHIYVESKSGHGSIFKVKLPLAEPLPVKAWT